MSDANEERRRFLILLGLAAPVAALTACSGDEPSASQPAAPAAGPAPVPAKTDETVAPAAEEPAVDAAAGSAQSELPRLSESDPAASSLGYVHDATQVDSARYPQHRAGQQCSNCALYQGDAGSEWAGCPIFAGKAVKATGWCSAYAPGPG